jgi:hypothetical protein
VRRNAVNARDAGLDLIARINRWFVAGAVVLTGAVSVAAARSFHGHSSGAAATQSAGSGSSSTSSGGSSTSSGGSLQQPSQAPSTSSPAPAPVVSGGS